MAMKFENDIIVSTGLQNTQFHMKSLSVKEHKLNILSNFERSKSVFRNILFKADNGSER